MDSVMDLRQSKTLLSSTACYERYSDAIGRRLTRQDVAMLMMTTVPCKVYPRAHMIHVRRYVEVDGALPASHLEVNPVEFDPDRHVIVTCTSSHVNQSLGLDSTLCGAHVRGWTHGRCVVWW